MYIWRAGGRWGWLSRIFAGIGAALTGVGLALFAGGDTGDGQADAPGALSP